MTEPSKTMLHVGCGPKRLHNLTPGFNDGTWREVRLDIDERHKPDVLGTITDMSSVADNSMDALYSSHNIEHVFPHEVVIVLREFRRVLKPSGFAVITCPDIQCLGEALAAGRLMEPLYGSGMGPISPIDILYGHRASIEKGQHYMAHKTAFTAQSLNDELRQAGFAAIGISKRWQGATNLWVVATKEPQPVEALRDMMGSFFVAKGPRD